MKSQVSFFSYSGSCTLQGRGVNSEVNNGLTESGELPTGNVGDLATYTETPKIPVSCKM